MLSSWLKSWWRAPRKSRSQARRPSFRPTLLALEDRLALSTLSTYGTIAAGPGPATHLQVIAPASVQEGTAFTVTVKAEGFNNVVITNFTGAVNLASSQTTAGGASAMGTLLSALPLNYTFTAKDQGVHVFRIDLSTGSATVTATSVASASITGKTSITVAAPSGLSQLVVVTPSAAAVGAATSVTVAAVDASGNLLTNYSGTVTLSSSDKGATGLPSTYTFTAGDAGRHTFQVTFANADAAGASTTVTATAGATTGQGALTIDSASQVTHFALLTRSAVVAGSSWALVVEALNASNQVVTGYTGTVAFSSSDPGAVLRTNGAKNLLPFSYTFTAADAGVHLFYVSFATANLNSLTATDSVAQASTTVAILVSAPPWYYGYSGYYGYAGYAGNYGAYGPTGYLGYNGTSL